MIFQHRHHRSLSITHVRSKHRSPLCTKHLNISVPCGSSYRCKVEYNRLRGFRTLQPGWIVVREHCCSEVDPIQVVPGSGSQTQTCIKVLQIFCSYDLGICQIHYCTTVGRLCDKPIWIPPILEVDPDESCCVLVLAASRQSKAMAEHRSIARKLFRTCSRGRGCCLPPEIDRQIAFCKPLGVDYTSRPWNQAMTFKRFKQASISTITSIVPCCWHRLY